MFRTLVAFACLVTLSFTPLFKGMATMHFHPSKLQLPLPYCQEWEDSSISEEVRVLLNQPFHFLAHGSQTYVFESADGKTVLKLFRYNRSKFPWIHSLKGLFHKKKKVDLFTKLDKTFQAYALAFQHVPERTGLLALHFNSTEENLPKVNIRDPLGRHWQLPLDSVRFVLQKKAEPFERAFLAAKDDTVIKEMIDSFVALLKERSGKGIHNSDPNMRPNFGFIDGKAVEIDCGNFRWRPQQDQNEEIARFTTQLRAWLAEHAPLYVEYLESL